MRTYRRVTLHDRLEIAVCLDLKLSKSEIARRLGFHKSTISREIKRNAKTKYFPHRAQKLSHDRFQSCRRPTKLTDSLKNLVKSRLSEHWSPEQISGRLKIESRQTLSHETIYRLIRADKKNGGSLWRTLRRPPKRGRGRYLVRNYKPAWLLRMKDRPQIINERRRIGDWERDTMLGLNRKPLLVLVERKTRLLKIKHLSALRANEVGLKTKELLANEPLHSITNDNGTEFRDFYLHACPIYFCDPLKPQQRGTVENTIGLLRQFITNKTDPSSITEEELKDLENKMNSRPRKCLGFKTPFEVHHQTSVALVS